MWDLVGNPEDRFSHNEAHIVFLLQRLAIAREFGDKAAERRAYSNLGNAHVFLGEFEVAAEHYRYYTKLQKKCNGWGNTYNLKIFTLAAVFLPFNEPLSNKCLHLPMKRFAHVKCVV